MFKRNIAVLSIIIVTVTGILLWFFNVTGPVNSNNTESIDFTISSGQSVQTIAENLKIRGLVKDTNAFLLYVKVSGLGTQIQAGNYKLNKAMSVSEVANQLTHGVNDIWIKVIEGWRVEEIAEYLETNFAVSAQEFILEADEGYMFPDTYSIPVGSGPLDIANIMRGNFDKKVGENIINEINNQGLSLHEGITLASILEREVKHENDRPIVAGIYLKRLRNEWPLQADATVQYALGYSNEESSWWKKGLTIDDLAIDSFYNTYIVTGLPPGPISNPGLGTIKAVANPKDSPYWYYISDSGGTLHYAETIEEHEANILKYLR